MTGREDPDGGLRLRCGTCEYDPLATMRTRYRAYEEAGKDGCHRCYLIATGTRLLVEKLQMDECHYGLSGWEDTTRLSFRSSNKTFDVSLVLEENLIISSVEFYTEEGAEVKHSEKLRTHLGRHIKTDGMSKPCLKFASATIRDCDESHACNTMHRTGFVPSRLLDLSRDNLVQLVEGADIPATIDYTALSYCWGEHSKSKSIFLGMTRQSLQDRKKRGWELVHLPVVFHDAVEVTKGLGLRCLWIDALCIAQGDRHEWAKESTNMGYIYSNAYVTIAACASASSEESFLSVDTYRKWRKEIAIPGSEIHGTCPKVYARWTEDGMWALCPSLKARSYDRARMQTRAWTYQEILLSPRVLTFEHGRVVFSCMRRHQTEDGVSLMGHTYRVLGMKSKMNTLELKEAYVSDVDEAFQALWAWLVMSYTEREASFPSDRLPAIAGVASALQLRLDPHNAYLAGLWKKSFIRQLLWAQEPRPSDRTVYGFESCEAPSWSWASILGTTNGIEQFTEDVLEYTRLVDVILSHGAAGEFGQVESGKILLEGPSAQLIGMKR